MCISVFIVYVRASVCISVCELIVQWLAINGLSQSISLQEHVCKQKAHQAGESLSTLYAENKMKLKLYG